MNSVRAIWPQYMCVKQNHFLFVNSIFSQNNGIFLFLNFILFSYKFLFNIFCSIFLFNITSAVVALIDVCLGVLYREIVIYFLFSTERKIKAESGGGEP